MKFTHKDKILLAACSCETHVGSCTLSFKLTDLVVRVWETDKGTFGLEGYADLYPDCNKVVSYLCGGKGLVAEELLARPEPKRYIVTPEGRRYAQMLRDVLPKESPPKPLGLATFAPKPYTLPKDKDMALRNMFVSNAVGYWRRQNKSLITFRDARDFWAVAGDDKSPGPATEVLTFVRNLAFDVATEYVLADGRSVTAGDVIDLLRLQDWLEKRFVGHLKLLRGRVEKEAS